MPRGLHWLVFISALALAGAQEENPVTVRLEAFLVSVVTNEDGGAEEEFTPTTTALPGEVVEYRLTIVNEGDRTLPPNSVMVRGPIPEAARYLDGSATATSEQVLTEFSVDGGGGFSEPPLMLAGGRPAAAEDYTMIRWTVLVPLEPGATLNVVYRVEVRQQ